MCAGSFETGPLGTGHDETSPAAAGSGPSPRGVALRCGDGHSFDIAKQGYVSLLDGRSGSLRADTAAMVAARARVHDAGFFTPVLAAVADRTRELGAGVDKPVVLDAGAGGGHYLRAAVSALADSSPSVRARGLGIDLSKFCARAISRGTPRHAAIVADIWRGLPIADDAATVVLSVFAPRNAAEFARVLQPHGGLVVVSPAADHLAEIIEPMQMLRVDSGKYERLQATFADGFEVVDSSTIRHVIELDAQTVGDLVAMGPSAFHADDADIRSRADAFVGGGTVGVTLSVVVTTCRPIAQG
ncbi:methyltransferase type 11 [Gordonia alkanivorans]|uniref:putative RNA methyltransferase n=1 Tax=Gordonia TaxID=2053 RepID=UPI0004B1C78B|nr:MULTISPECIES: methyltransferase type 11 [Gordonia]MDH3015472.1 methyltransferase type 11 [Gordonia alkanivorans]MDH3020207.1 methyltransferase type 11 [Gordonia alkanivorans]MDH3040379.1 methyltransferase type 11 [Gordonia alkanivorans]MDH3048820.1 methyltransferase type 11 [Gordonia alkanivorans]MDJ0026390.1 methyltransferase type 11 [Gordonia alkanivorans]